MIVQIQDVIIFQKFLLQNQYLNISASYGYMPLVLFLVRAFFIDEFTLTFPKEKVIITWIGHITLA